MRDMQDLQQPIQSHELVGIVGDLSSETFKMLKTSLVWLGARASSSPGRDYADIAYFHTSDIFGLNSGFRCFDIVLGEFCAGVLAFVADGPVDV